MSKNYGRMQAFMPVGHDLAWVERGILKAAAALLDEKDARIDALEARVEALWNDLGKRTAKHEEEEKFLGALWNNIGED